MRDKYEGMRSMNSDGYEKAYIDVENDWKEIRAEERQRRYGQIPKEPIIVDYNYSNLPVEGCPTCKSRKIQTDDKFCRECGQALKWD